MSAVARRGLRRAAAAEDEGKAFWISFADLMTALMVLFLMVMAVAVMAITRSLSAATPEEAAQRRAAVARLLPDAEPGGGTPEQEAQALQQLMNDVARIVEATPGLHFDPRRRVIDFGDRARFPSGSHVLDPASARLLREFTPQLLQITESELGRRWVSRVVVEGFADPRGDYLFNLNLSLQRGQRVLCTLLGPARDGSALSPAQQDAVRGIFSVAGFSFNAQRESFDASRRIEMRIEFGQRPPTPPAAAHRGAPADDPGPCRLPGSDAATAARDTTSAGDAAAPASGLAPARARGEPGAAQGAASAPAGTDPSPRPTAPPPRRERIESGSLISAGPAAGAWRRAAHPRIKVA